MITNKIDLHFHSNASDGLLTPSQLIKYAKDEGVRVLALTDHDTVSNNEEMEELSKEYNIKFIPGIELSTRYNGESIHILGYFRNQSYKNPIFLKRLEDFRNNRVNRAREIVDRLKKFYNIEISLDELLSSSDSSIGRPHIAKLIQRKYGYGFDDIFKRFLSDSSKAYIPSSKLSLEEGIGILSELDCIKILAHPGQYKSNTLDLLKFDIDGLECFYSQHTNDQVGYFLKICSERNLLVTCGSDYHGIERDVKHGELGSTFFIEEKVSPFLEKFDYKFDILPSLSDL